MNKKKDENELAKSVIDDIIAETESQDFGKPINKIAQKGGLVRAKNLTNEKKSEIAKKAADIRWQKHCEKQKNSSEKWIFTQQFLGEALLEAPAKVRLLFPL